MNQHTTNIHNNDILELSEAWMIKIQGGNDEHHNDDKDNNSGIPEDSAERGLRIIHSG